MCWNQNTLEFLEYNPFCHSDFFFFFLTLLQFYLGFLSSSAGKEFTCSARDLGLIPGLRKSPGGGHGKLLQYSCLENPHGQRSQVGYSPWGGRKSDTTEWLSVVHLPLEFSSVCIDEIGLFFLAFCFFTKFS